VAAIRNKLRGIANLLAVLEGKTPTEIYDGYSSYSTEYGKLMLAEFGL
jgi:hypothetical protein